MKQLKTTDMGGHPIYYTDFEFIQEQIRELAEASFKHLVSTTNVLILNSVEWTISTDGYTIEITRAGWAFYNGEYFYVPLHAATGASPSVAKWQIVETYDPRGHKKFYETSVGYRDVYNVRTLQVAFLPVAISAPLFIDTELAHPPPVIIETAWVIATLQSPYLTVGYPFEMRYRKNQNGDLQLYGIATSSLSTLHNVVMFVLPLEFRPQIDVIFPITWADGTDVYDGHLAVKSNGEVMYRGVNHYAAPYIYVNHTIVLKNLV